MPSAAKNSRKGARVKLKKNAANEETSQAQPDASNVDQQSEASASTRPRRSLNEHSILLAELSPIIEAAQHANAKIDKLIEKAQRIYNNREKKIFAAVLWRMMIVPFQVKDKSENAERVIKFFHTMVNQITQMQRDSTQDPDPETTDGTELNGTVQKSRRKDWLSHRILHLCEKYHDEARPHVRARIVQTIVKICESTESMDEFDSNLKKGISNVLLTRLQDKHHNVRIEAAKGLCYFQGGQKCDITAKMMEFIRIDTRPEVRKALVMSIVLDSDNYGDFLDRCTDVHPEVRRACFHQIKEIAFDSITFLDKEKIVQCGLNDASSAVRAEAVKLLHHWLKVCGNTLSLLHKLDVYNRPKMCQKVLDTLFEEANEETWEKIGTDFLVDKFIPLEDLNEQKMYLWWYLFHKFSKIPFYADKLFPSMGEVYSYGVKFMNTLKTEFFDEDEGHNLLELFMKIVLFLPLEDGGRLVLDKLVREIFKFENKSVFHMKSLVCLVHKAHPCGCDEILLEIIRDMMEATSVSNTIPENVPHLFNREDEIRNLKLKLSTVLHNKHKLMKEKEEYIKNSLFLEAHATQERFKLLEEEAAKIREEINAVESASNNPAMEIEDEEAPQSSTNYSSEAIYFAFSAFLVHLRKVTKISQYLRNFYQAEVMKSIFREENEIRSQVLQIMTTIGFFSHADACHAMVVCIQALLNEQLDVKNVALRCIFDLVLKFGLENFEDASVKAVLAVQIEDMDHDEPDVVAKMLVQLLTSYLTSSDDPMTLHIAILGLMKLLIMGRLKLPKIVATLLTFWANSANDGTKIYHDIGNGLAMYIQQSSDRAETVARALVPSLSKVINAPMRSQLRRVDPEKLMGFITNQTSQAKFINYAAPHMPHQIIAFDILDEIRKRPACVDNAIYVKALKGLSLQGMSKDDILEIKSKVKSAMKEELRPVCQSLHAFGTYLDALDPELKPLELLTDRESSSESEADDQQENTVDMFQTLKNNTVVRRSTRKSNPEADDDDENDEAMDTLGNQDDDRNLSVTFTSTKNS